MTTVRDMVIDITEDQAEELLTALGKKYHNTGKKKTLIVPVEIVEVSND